ncbi:ABC transporter substrate-binding protein [Devosia sp. 1635]|uniref:ABC transporter substrate-binding protein n=1 Tax=Devosia sp. 1635 TaxID=2726066 RepID=UPI00156493C7|nr:ABC transporter substrate-binding protein [Devosia sp. 1635]
MRRLAVALTALALLVPGLAPAQAQTSGGTFSLPINDDPQIWPVAGGLFNILVNKTVYSGLIRYDLETLEPVGDLAESWTVSEDGLTYTFKLRPNVVWHDGEQFNADDVVYTLNEIWTNPDVPYYLANNFRLIEEVTKVDDFTVNVRLERPQVAFPVLLGYNAAILPEHLLSGLTPEQLVNPADFLRNPVGTGPFKFAEYSPGSFVRLVRNDAYFGGVPHLDAMVFRIVPDANAQLALLQSGEIDLVVIEPFQLAAVENNPNVQIQSVPVTRHEFISVNNGLEHLDDVNVRKALTLALDREQLLATVFMGRGSVATGPFAPSVAWAYNDAIEPLPFDPAQAEALLEQSGWVMGPNNVRVKDGQDLSFTMLYDPANPTRTRTALIAQQQWAEVGVAVDFETAQYGAVVERIRQDPPNYELNPNYLIAPPDPDGVANYYLSTSLANSWDYNKPEIDELLNAGATTLDQAERAEIYKQIQVIIHEDQPNVYTVFPDEIQALSTSVERFPEAGYRDALGWAHLISKR